MVALVTGAYGVFGVHITEGLLAAGIATICIVRDRSKAETLVSKMKAKYPNVPCTFMICDVARHSEVKKLATSLGDTPIDILVNNAAVTPRARSVTADGIEQQWACNVLGYHWMMKELEQNLFKASCPPARVVNVASSYAGGLNLIDPEYKTRTYDTDASYRASKQANRMTSRLWAERWPADRVAVFSCHPGVATSAVSLGLGFDMDRSQEAARAGAQTPLFLCLDPSPLAHSVGFFSHRRAERCPLSADPAANRQLWDLLESFP